MGKGPWRHATIVGIYMREGTDEWEKAMRTEVLWASAYAARGDIVGCTATLRHPDRSEPATSSSRPKLRDLLFAWIARGKNCGIVMP
jgi:hypothetical protein